MNELHVGLPHGSRNDHRSVESERTSLPNRYILTFCYGPLSCPLYKSGPPRKLPGRRGMTYTEEDWIDDEATSHRSPDE
jgi:hypothetical protein